MEVSSSGRHIERDERCLPALEQVSQAFGGRLSVVSADATRVDEATLLQPGEPALTAARLGLARATATVIASGLNVCGVEPANELR